MTVGPSKLVVFEHLLADGWVNVRFDGRAKGVRVPAHLQTKPACDVCVGYGMPIPIRDLKFDDAGISGTLSFHRVQHPCFIPWSAIYVMARQSDGFGRIWKEDEPADALEEQLPQERRLRLVR